MVVEVRSAGLTVVTKHVSTRIGRMPTFATITPALHRPLAVKAGP